MGLEQPQPFAWRTTRAGDGTLYLIVARRSERGEIGDVRDGALYRSTDGAHWARVGDAVASGYSVQAVARGGTYLVDAGLVEVIRQAGATRQLADAPPGHGLATNQVSPDGLCVAYVARVADGKDVLRSLDVASGRTFDLLPRDPADPYAVTWVPRR